MTATPPTSFSEVYDRVGSTRFVAPEIDLNAALRATGQPQRLTRWTAWDAEVRKALDPDVYLPSRFASSTVWGEDLVDTATTSFLRHSRQRSWVDGAWVSVVERVTLDPVQQRIWFVGLRQAVGPDGRTVRATSEQPLFVVEHGVEGTDDDPMLHFAVALRTSSEDASLVAPLATMTALQVPEYVQIYLSRTSGSVGSRATVEDAHETPAARVQWARPFGPRGPQMATLWGDPATGPHGSLLKFAPGADSGLHTHPHDSTGLVVQGTLVHTYEGQPPGVTMGPGSWYFEPAGVPHVSRCGDAEACIVLVYNPGPFGFEPAISSR
ncbi:MAG: cupin domain-containing protein [Myxococcales bacterium]|nr:cupin domain-containing protein [Myxococcales bacterium]